MKKVIPCLILVFSTLLSCKEKLYFKEIISNKNVTISVREMDGEKCKVINIPIEFSLNLNQKDIKDVGIYYHTDSKAAMELQDYLVYNGDTNKILFAIEDLEYGKYPKSIYIVDRRFRLTDEQATEMINKYAPEKSIFALKTKDDTISLVSYKKFREDYPKFLEKMRKEPDTLKLSIGFSKGREEVFSEKINW